MITKVSYKPYASGVSSTKNQPQKVNFGATTPQEVGEALACHLGNLISSSSRGKINQDLIMALNFLKIECGLSDEIYRASMRKISQFSFMQPSAESTRLGNRIRVPRLFQAFLGIDKHGR